MNLLINYFKPDNKERHAEYLYCLHENIPFFDKIYVFTDEQLNLTSPKIVIIKSGRPTYKDMFSFANEELSGQICIVANSDIIFNESINRLKEINLNKTFIVLSRWESDGMLNRTASQDVWAFQAPIKATNDMEFFFGRPGCDNRIACIMIDLGYEIRNPAEEIIARHFHASEYRPELYKPKVNGPYLIAIPNNDVNKKSDYLLKDNL